MSLCKLFACFGTAPVASVAPTQERYRVEVFVGGKSQKYTVSMDEPDRDSLEQAAVGQEEPGRCKPSAGAGMRSDGSSSAISLADSAFESARGAPDSARACAQQRISMAFSSQLYSPCVPPRLSAEPVRQGQHAAELAMGMRRTASAPLIVAK